MAYNFIKPKKTVVKKGIEGRKIMYYGDSDVGKTLEAIEAPDCIVLDLEGGMGDIDGVDYVEVKDWATFTLVVDDLLCMANIEETRKTYKTIVIDSLDRLLKCCSRFIVTAESKQSLADVEGYQKGEKRYSFSFDEYLDKLVKCGLTIIFLCHSQVRKRDETGGKINQFYPRGAEGKDELDITPVVELCDIVVYLESKGTQADGTKNLSTGYLATNKHHFARNRIKGMPTEIPNFSTKKLIAKIDEAITSREKKEGFKAKVHAPEDDNNNVVAEFNSLRGEIRQYYDKYKAEDSIAIDNGGSADKGKEFKVIVEKHLGSGRSMGDATSGQVSHLKLILNDLVQLDKSLEESKTEQAKEKSDEQAS